MRSQKEAKPKIQQSLELSPKVSLLGEHIKHFYEDCERDFDILAANGKATKQIFYVYKDTPDGILFSEKEPNGTHPNAVIKRYHYQDGDREITAILGKNTNITPNMSIKITSSNPQEPTVGLVTVYLPKNGFNEMHTTTLTRDGVIITNDYFSTSDGKSQATIKTFKESRLTAGEYICSNQEYSLENGILLKTSSTLNIPSKHPNYVKRFEDVKPGIRQNRNGGELSLDDPKTMVKLGFAPINGFTADGSFYNSIFPVHINILSIGSSTRNLLEEIKGSDFERSTF